MILCTLESIIYKHLGRLATFPYTLAEFPNLIFLVFFSQLALWLSYIAIFRVPVFSALHSPWKMSFCPCVRVDQSSVYAPCVSAVQQWHLPWNLRKMCVRVGAIVNKPHAKLLLVIFHVFSLAPLAKSKEFKILRSFVSFFLPFATSCHPPPAPLSWWCLNFGELLLRDIEFGKGHSLRLTHC